MRKCCVGKTCEEYFLFHSSCLLNLYHNKKDDQEHTLLNGHASQSNLSAVQSNRKSQMNSITVCHTSQHSVYVSVEVFQPESPLVVMQWMNISSAKFGLDQRHRTSRACSIMSLDGNVKDSSCAKVSFSSEFFNNGVILC